MDKYIKYIFFFVLGIIIHLILKMDLVEGYSTHEHETTDNPGALDTSDAQFTNYDKRNVICSVNRNSVNCEGVSRGWRKSPEIDGFKHYGVEQISHAPGTQTYYTPNSCSTNNDVYDQLCFKNTLEDDDPHVEPVVTSASGCKVKCDMFNECGSFSFDNDNGNDRCCLYKIGYKGYSDTAAGNCYTKKDCSSDASFVMNNCLCNGSNTCRVGETCNEDGSCSTNNASTILAYLRGSGNICKTSSDDEDTPVNDLGVCACDESVVSDESYIAIDRQPVPETADKLICRNDQICNQRIFPLPTIPGGTHEYSRCHTLVTNTDDITPCDYINGSSIDSGIVTDDEPGCFCASLDIDQTNIIRMCKSDSDIKRYCKISNQQCTDLDDCESSNNILLESCKYNIEGDEHNPHMCNYLNESGHRDKIFNEHFPEADKCKTIGDCELGIVPDNGYCFCSTEDSDDKHLCNPGRECNNPSGCIERLQCQPSYYEYDDAISKCLPTICLKYSETNASSIEHECQCGVHEDTNLPFICQRGYYCLDNTITPNIPYSGCVTEEHLIENCSYYSENNLDPIQGNCRCNTDSRDSDENPLICSEGNFCLNPEGCYPNRCEGQKNNIMDPDNSQPRKCKASLDDTNLVDKIIDEINVIIEKIKNLLKI